MKIFVTGATGFIGRAFCREAIKRGHHLLALTRDPNAKNQPGLEIAQGTLVNTPWDLVADFAPDAALHLAWIAEPGVYLNSPENEIWLEQSKLWFTQLFKMGVPHIAGAGTCIEYAASNEPLVEDSSLISPLYPYSRAKAALFDWLKTSVPGDSSWSWFRIFYPYGPGEHANRVCTSLIHQLSAGKPISLKTPDSVKDYIYIDDLAAALCLSLESKKMGAINLGTGSGTSILELAQLIATLLRADPALVQAADQKHHDPSPIVLAHPGLLKSTGWSQEISLDIGLRRLIGSIVEANK
jgi:dTDP-6-deoxy-L-talose 4-dehydrogenase (NAD+)